MGCVALAATLLGCPDDPTGTAGSGAGAGGSGAGGAGAGGTGGGPGGSGGTGGAGGEPPTFDCATAPTEPLEQRVLTGPRGYHGLAINEAGRIFGTNVDLTLVHSSYEGDWAPFVPNVVVDQIAFAESGHLILAASDGLIGITPDAQRYTINAELYGYGLRIGPDGRAWLAEPRAIRRVNLVTGLADTIVTVPDIDMGTFAHAFDFSPSLDALYVGMTGETGMDVRVVQLDENLDATGVLEDFANVAEGKVWIDGVATDVCGNLYVANFATSQLSKITPDGVSSLYFDWSADPTQYGHGVIFGNGVGGFREDAIYLPMPYNEHTVQEIVVGIPSRTWKGIPISAP